MVQCGVFSHCCLVPFSAPLAQAGGVLRGLIFIWHLKTTSATNSPNLTPFRRAPFRHFFL